MHPLEKISSWNITTHTAPVCVYFFLHLTERGPRHKRGKEKLFLPLFKNGFYLPKFSALFCCDPFERFPWVELYHWYRILYHFSEINSFMLDDIWHSERLQNLIYFWNTKTLLRASLYFPPHVWQILKVISSSINL